MKNSCIKNFSFLPSDFDCMHAYLDEMLEKGWRLKWVRAGFAGFVKNELEHVHYVVEPYPNMNVMTIRRMPKTWLSFYTDNSWYFVGKSRGNFIYFTDRKDPKPPSQTSSMVKNDSKQKVISAEMTRNAALLVVLAFLTFQLLSSAKFMYAFVLTNLFQYLSVILAVLAASAVGAILLYALEIVRLSAGTFRADPAGGLKRGLLYHIRNGVILALLLLFFLLETADTPQLLIYLALPVIALIIGGAVIAAAAAKAGDGNTSKKIMPFAYAFGAVAVVLLMFSMTRIQAVNTAAKAAAAEASLEKADSLPLLRYTDFFSGEYKARSRENNSYLGKNYLYQEEDASREHIVFTNYTVMNSRSGARRIFTYLYDQAQTDYMGSFEPFVPSGNEAVPGDAEIWKIHDKNAFLIRRDNSVILATVSDSADPEAVGQAVVKLVGSL